MGELSPGGGGICPPTCSTLHPAFLPRRDLRYGQGKAWDQTLGSLVIVAESEVLRAAQGDPQPGPERGVSAGAAPALMPKYMSKLLIAPGERRIRLRAWMQVSCPRPRQRSGRFSFAMLRHHSTGDARRDRC